MFRFIKYAVCVLAAVLIFSAIGTGDVGNFNDYSSGGGSWSSPSSGSSSGGSSWSWGSDSSSDTRSSWASNSDRRSEGVAHDHDWSRREPLTPSDVIFVLVIALFFGIIGYIAFTQWGQPPSQNAPGWVHVPDHSYEITQAVKEYDPAFNAIAFLEWAKEVFIKLQYAWMDRDWEQVRPFESEELYAQHARQLQEYKRLGRINVLERINVNNAYFFQLVKDPKWETLWVVMNVRMIDYIIDEQSRRVLKGFPDRDCFMSYFYVFKRKAGAQTASAKQNVDTIACPNCGAPTHVVSSGRCEYCNFVITVKDHGWVLTDIVGIKPSCDYGTGGVFIQDKTEE